MSTSNSNLMTKNQFLDSLPENFHKRGVPDKVMDDINAMLAEGETGEVFKENLMSHNHILKEGKFSLEQYVNAVKYISFRLLNNSQRRSYELTFPDKVTQWLAEGMDEKAISAYVHAFNNTKLVMRLYDVTLVPFHLLNQPYRQEALLVEVDLMRNAGSEMVRHKAAESVLNILTPPENLQTELQLKAAESKENSQLKDALADLAKAQKELIEKGGSLKEVAESTIVNGEYEEVESG